MADALIDEIDAPIDPAEGGVAPVDGEAQQPSHSPEQVLAAIMARPNIAEDLPPDQLSSIGMKVCEEYEIDKTSREKWVERNKEAMELANLVAKSKDYPFPGAANVKYPLITTAALQFNARAYPAIVASDRVVKCKTWGDDAQGLKAARADRVSEHMSYQLLVEQPEWEEDTDRMLMMVPISGCAFRKTYYDNSLMRNVSRLIPADRFVVNYWARSLDDVPRITEELNLYPYEIEERIRDGRYTEFDYKSSTGTASKEGEGKQQSDPQDDSAPHMFLEQHRLLDLDEDGYSEPYIVTVHEPTQKVVRIMPNFSAETVKFAPDGRIAAIRRQSWFVKYGFFPNPEGGFYDWGLGFLLKDIGEAINTTLNQMLDAGHLSNIQGGLVSSVLGIREKSIKISRGEWRVLNTGGVPLNQAVLPIKYDGPSPVLFQLLGLLIEAGKEVSNTKDVLTGESRPNQTATATLALIEQGLQVFTAIYKRLFRALKAEFAIIKRLNREHVTPEAYAEFFDEQQAPDPVADYADKDMDVTPVSDPSAVSKMQKLAKAQLVLDSSKENPLVNPEEALRRFYEAAEVEDIDKLLVPPQPPDPEVVAMAKRAANAEVEEKEANAANKLASAIKSLADAEGVEAGSQMAFYGQVLNMLKNEHAMEKDIAQAGAGGLPGMEGQPNDATGLGAPPGAGNGAASIPAGPVGEPVVAPPAGMGSAAGAGGVPQGAL